MVVSIRSNLASLQAQRYLGRTTGNLGDIFERLSSGQRINKAGDDAAGLAISSALDVDKHILHQSVRNLNDGVSYLNIADAALEEAGNILIRIEELSIQAANGSYSSDQRSALDLEAQALKNEFSRILGSTQFNELEMFTNEEQSVSLATGLTSGDTLDVAFRNTIETTSGLGTFTNNNITIRAAV